MVLILDGLPMMVRAVYLQMDNKADWSALFELSGLRKITKVGNILTVPHQPFSVNLSRCPLRKPTSAIGNECCLVIDHEEWVAILEPALCQDSAAVECLARLLFTIKKAIESGPGDLERAINTLSDGIELAYLYTDEHKLALKLYMLYLTGHLKPQDEPLILLNGAIERGTDRIERARKKGDSAKYNRTKKRGALKKKQ